MKTIFSGEYTVFLKVQENVKERARREKFFLEFPFSSVFQHFLSH